MSWSTLLTVTLRLALATGILVTCCTLGLPLIAAPPDGVAMPPPLWGFIGPLLGAGAAAALLVIRTRALRRGIRTGRAANLPAQVVLLFTLGGSLGILVVALLEQDAMVVHRPLVVFLCGPALAIAVGLLLRAMVQPPLLAELARQGEIHSGGADGGSPPKPDTPARPARPRGFGVLAIRPTLTLVSGGVVVVTLALIGGHIYSIAQHDREQSSARFLRHVVAVVSARTGQLEPATAAEVLAKLPRSEEVEVLALDSRGRIATGRPGFSKGQRVSPARGGRCRVGRRVHRCARSAGLVALDPTPEQGTITTLSSVAARLGLVALGFFAFTFLLGWAMGTDISRDFRAITTQLHAMAHQSSLDLGRPVTVTSIDEVGDLTEALGRLRTRLELELDQHNRSMRKVREAERAKNEFFSGVSQELRTPLTTLCGYAQLLLDGSEGELTATQREDIQSIYTGGQQLLALVNDVLDISVIESGTLQLSREQVDLASLCREQVQGQRAALEAEQRKQEVELRLELEQPLPRLHADPRRLAQVVSNLLSNALKFTEEGSVTMRARPLEEDEELAPGVKITVEDTGVGISQVELPGIFDSYRQAGELSMRRKGSGLGLAITRHLVERHGGTITAASEPGQGSTFTVVLPASGGAS